MRCGLLGRRDTAKAARGIPGGFGGDEEGDCALSPRGEALPLAGGPIGELLH